MLTVSHGPAAVESELFRGMIFCPGCGQRLRPWGWARRRLIRHGAGAGQRLVWHQPRRGRCTDCLATHVLLEVSLAFRRADSAEVIAAAVQAKAIEGQGHRGIAGWLGRPATTVRGWLRAVSASAATITEVFTTLVARDAVDAAEIWPKPAANAAGAAMAAVSAYAQAVRQRFGLVGTVTWFQAGITASAGRLFCASWWAERSQHEFALTPVPRPGAD